MSTVYTGRDCRCGHPLIHTAEGPRCAIYGRAHDAPTRPVLDCASVREARRRDRLGRDPIAVWPWRDDAPGAALITAIDRKEAC